MDLAAIIRLHFDQQCVALFSVMYAWALFLVWLAGWFQSMRFTKYIIVVVDPKNVSCIAAAHSGRAKDEERHNEREGTNG